jgi:hypothetical protein
MSALSSEPWSLDRSLGGETAISSARQARWSSGGIIKLFLHAGHAILPRQK